MIIENIKYKYNLRLNLKTIIRNVNSQIKVKQKKLIYPKSQSEMQH